MIVIVIHHYIVARQRLEHGAYVLYGIRHDPGFSRQQAQRLNRRLGILHQAILYIMREQAKEDDLFLNTRAASSMVSSLLTAPWWTGGMKRFCLTNLLL